MFPYIRASGYIVFYISDNFVSFFFSITLGWQKYKWRYTKIVTITKLNLPEAPKEGRLRNKYWQHKRLIWNHRRMHKLELHHRYRIGMAPGWAVGRFKSVLFAQNLALNSDVVANCSAWCCICVVMLALWSPSSIAVHFGFCFTSCVVMLAFWSHFNSCTFCFLYLLVVIKSGIGTQGDVSRRL